MNPVKALIFFFRLLYSNCLNWKFTAKITYHLHIYPQFIYESFHIHYIISLLSRENMNSQLTSLPMCGCIAQLVEHCTGIRGGHGFESHYSPDFFQASSFQLLKLEIHCEDHISPSSSTFFDRQIEYFPVKIYIFFTQKCLKLLQKPQQRAEISMQISLLAK